MCVAGGGKCITGIAQFVNDAERAEIASQLLEICEYSRFRSILIRENDYKTILDIHKCTTHSHYESTVQLPFRVPKRFPGFPGMAVS